MITLQLKDESQLNRIRRALVYRANDTRRVASGLSSKEETAEKRKDADEDEELASYLRSV